MPSSHTEIGVFTGLHELAKRDSQRLCKPLGAQFGVRNSCVARLLEEGHAIGSLIAGANMQHTEPGLLRGSRDRGNQFDHGSRLRLVDRDANFRDFGSSWPKDAGRGRDSYRDRIACDTGSRDRLDHGNEVGDSGRYTCQDDKNHALSRLRATLFDGGWTSAGALPPTTI